MVNSYLKTKNPEKQSDFCLSLIKLYRSVNNEQNGKSTTNNTGYKNGRIVISCLESEEMAIKQKAKEQNKTVSRLIIDSVLNN